jgi:hypothetical protein
MKSKGSILISIAAAALLCAASIALMSAKPAGLESGIASLAIHSSSPVGGDSARSVPASMNFSVSVPDGPNWPAPLLYLLVGAALIGASSAMKHVSRHRRKPLSTGKLPEISDLNVLALASPRQASSSLEHEIRNRRGDPVVRHG